MPEMIITTLLWGKGIPDGIVQQPCSSRGEQQRTRTTTLREKCADLQVILNAREQPQIPQVAFAWRRSRVRVSSGPLRKLLIYAEFACLSTHLEAPQILFDTNLAPRHALLSVLQSCTSVIARRTAIRRRASTRLSPNHAGSRAKAFRSHTTFVPLWPVRLDVRRSARLSA